MSTIGMRAHLLQQGTGALNDNLFRQVFTVLIIMSASSQADGLAQTALLGLCFMLPFLLAAPLAASLAERFAYDRIIRWIRGCEPVLCLLGIATIASGNPYLMMAVLAGFGLQSAVFAPVKYAIVPDLVDDDHLERGNGQLSAATQIAILLGITLAFVADTDLLAHSPLSGLPPAVTVGLIALPLTALGIIAARRIPPQAPKQAGAPMRPFNWAGILRSLAHRPGLVVPAVSSACFWAIAAAIQVSTVSLGHACFGFGMSENALLAAALGVAMSAGALLTDRLNTRAFPAALPALSVIGAGIGLTQAGQAAVAGHLTGFIVWLLSTAVVIAWWPVCMVTLLQRRSEDQRRGNVFAAAAFLGNIGTALGFGLLSSAATLLPTPVLLEALGAMLVAAGAAIVFVYRLQIGAWLIAMLAKTTYRIHVHHGERLPDGGALLVCNHQSYADALVLAAALRRPIRFIADGPYVSMPVIGWIMRLAGCIPIDGNGRNPASIRKALETATAAAAAGEVVCIFPEGRLSTSGQIGPFKRGLERIARQAGVPIIPAALLGLHGGVLSPAPHKRLPRPGYRVDLKLGPAMASETDCADARRAVTSLHADLFTATAVRQSTMTLAHRFLRQLRRKPSDLAMADDRGTLTRLQLGVAARAITPHLGLAADEQHVGILLPPGRAGAIINLGLAFAGKTAVNLNHTAGDHGLRQIVERTGIRTVITANAYVKRIGTPDLAVRYVAVEDLLPVIGTWAKIRAALALFCLPAAMLCRARRDDVAAVVFSSGSTGSPKGVQLTHGQIMANIDAMARHYDFHANQDRLLSPLPLFHSFGLSVGLWLGLCHGLPAVGQADPRDAALTGTLCQRHQATFIVSTPTFARGYLRRVSKEAFASLDFMVVGAEKCPVELCNRFREAYDAEIYEGYGCTELGPVVSANRPDALRGGLREINNKPGTIGRPLPGITVDAVDPDTLEPLPIGSDGLLIVRSPARMLGYLGEPERSAQVFVGDDGYNTGDIGHIDSDGFIHITGRLARFAKIGGEMVPLDNVEQALSALLPTDDDEHNDTELAVASVPDATKGERLIVLHAGELPYPPEDLLARIDHLPAIFKPKARDFYAVEAIPHLGTGKRDLGKLKTLAEEVAA